MDELSRYRLALLDIGSQHPAWTWDGNPSEQLVLQFNRITAQAREVVGAVGSNEFWKVTWCANEAAQMRRAA